MLFEKEALKDIKDLENIKKLYNGKSKETLNDAQSLISFALNQGTYMPGEVDKFKNKIIDLKLKQLFEAIERIHKEQKKYADIWFPKFKNIYKENKNIIQLGHLHFGIYSECYSIKQFYDILLQYKVSKITHPKTKEKERNVPYIRLLVKLEKKLLVEYIKLDKSFIYSHITYTRKWFRNIEIKRIALDEDAKRFSFPGGIKKAFIPYLLKQINYFKEKEFKLKPECIEEARFINEDSMPTVDHIKIIRGDKNAKKTN